MTGIWFDREHVRLKSYTATTKNTRSTVRIEIECNDPDSLGSLLRQLGEIDNEQKAREKPAPRRKTPALPSPPLQLPYFGNDEP